MPKQPESATATRRSTVVRHLLLSAVLWATYILYWRVVISRGVERQAALSLVLLGLFVALQVLFTQAWVLYNRRVTEPSRDRRRRRPAGVRIPTSDFLGRRLRAWPPQSDLTRAACIIVRVDGEEKRFEAGLPLEAENALERRR
jgi:hypothetical protein